MLNKSEKKLDDNALIQHFINDSQNTHNEVLGASVGSTLERLAKLYLRENGDEIDKISSHIAAQQDPSLDKAWFFMQEELKKAPGQWDKVTLWRDEQEETILLPLKEVLSIIYAALTDQTQFNAYPEESDTDKKQQLIQKDRADRLAALFSCFKNLHQKPVCPTGIRHELALTLSGVYPGVFFIEDFDIFLADMSREHIHQKLECIRQTDGTTYREILLAEIDIKAQRHCILANMLHASKGELTSRILNVCKEHGINLKIVSPKIDNFITYINDLELSPGSQSNIHCLRDILNAPSSDDNRGKALCMIKKWVRTAFQLDDEPMNEKIRDFVSAEACYLNLKKYALLMQHWQDGNLIKINEILEAYYLLCITESAPCILSPSDLNALNEVHYAVRAFRKDTHIAWIENIFIHFDLKNNLEISKRLYQELITQGMLEIILIPDIHLSELFPEEATEIYLTPYHINRLFLHAILVPWTSWTPLFERYFNQTYQFVSAGFSNHQSFMLAQNLMQNSYKPPLMAQLKYLQTMYQHQKNTHEPEPESPSLFPIPMRHVIRRFDHLNDVLHIMSKEDGVAFFLALENLHDLFTTTNQLVFALKFLPLDSHLVFLKSLGSDALKKCVRDEMQLLKVLENTPTANHSFLDILGIEHVKSIIQDRRQLGNILKELPKSDILLLLKALGSIHLRKIITTENQIIMTLDMLPPDEHAFFLYELLGMDYLMKTKARISFNCTIFNETHYPEANYLRKTITNSKQLINMLKCLPSSRRLFFLTARLGVGYLQCLINDGDIITRVLKRLPETNQRLALLASFDINYLKSVINSGAQLIKILEQIDEDERLPLLQRLGGDYLKASIKDVSLSTMIQKIPKTSRILLLNLLGGEDITDKWELFNILGDYLLEKDQILFLKHLGRGYLISILEDHFDIENVLWDMPKIDHMSFFRLLGADFVTRIIPNIETLNGVSTITQEAFRDFCNKDTLTLKQSYLNSYTLFHKGDLVRPQQPETQLQISKG